MEMSMFAAFIYDASIPDSAEEESNVMLPSRALLSKEALVHIGE